MNEELKFIRRTLLTLQRSWPYQVLARCIKVLTKPSFYKLILRDKARPAPGMRNLLLPATEINIKNKKALYNNTRINTMKILSNINEKPSTINLHPEMMQTIAGSAFQPVLHSFSPPGKGLLPAF